jgi:hypothetical protein
MPCDSHAGSLFGDHRSHNLRPGKTSDRQRMSKVFCERERNMISSAGNCRSTETESTDYEFSLASLANPDISFDSIIWMWHLACWLDIVERWCEIWNVFGIAKLESTSFGKCPSAVIFKIYRKISWWLKQWSTWPVRSIFIDQLSKNPELTEERPPALGLLTGISRARLIGLASFLDSWRRFQ